MLVESGEEPGLKLRKSDHLLWTRLVRKGLLLGRHNEVSHGTWADCSVLSDVYVRAPVSLCQKLAVRGLITSTTVLARKAKQRHGEPRDRRRQVDDAIE